MRHWIHGCIVALAIASAAHWGLDIAKPGSDGPGAGPEVMQQFTPCNPRVQQCG